MTRKHMWPWIPGIMLLIPEASHLPSEALEKGRNEENKHHIPPSGHPEIIRVHFSQRATAPVDCAFTPRFL